MADREPWRDVVKICDNFEYMVRPDAFPRPARRPDARAHLRRPPTADALTIASPPLHRPNTPQETATAATTGGHVWPAARRLLEYVEAARPPWAVRRGARILELGAGTGWMGMTLAANLPSADRVCVTETRAGGALKWLRRNVARNEDGAEEVLWRPGVVHVEACDWTAYSDEDGTDASTSKNDASRDDDDDDDDPTGSTPLSAGINPRLEAIEWDVIVGSDLVYDDDGVRYLPRVVRHFLRNNNSRHFLYAHTKYRYELRDMALWREFHECGLDVEEVREDGAPSPPSSPEPLTQLFPEKRIAVLRITLREEDE